MIRNGFPVTPSRLNDTVRFTILCAVSVCATAGLTVVSIYRTATARWRLRGTA